METKNCYDSWWCSEIETQSIHVKIWNYVSKLCPHDQQPTKHPGAEEYLMLSITCPPCHSRSWIQHPDGVMVPPWWSHSLNITGIWNLGSLLGHHTPLVRVWRICFSLFPTKSPPLSSHQGISYAVHTMLLFCFLWPKPLKVNPTF